MVGVYIFGGLVIVGLAVLIVYKTKWNRAAKTEARGRAEKIEEDRIEAVAKAEARGRK